MRSQMSVCVPEPGILSMQYTKQEFPTYGTGDYRSPALTIVQENGSRIVNFTYASHEIYNGKKDILPLPATYVENEDEAQTLEITLHDAVMDTDLILSYTIYEDYPVITRNAKISHKGSEKIVLDKIMSASVEYNDMDYEMVHLSGGWARERYVKTRRLEMGIQSIQSLNGTCSGAEQNPFLALKRPHTTENQGEVYGFSLVYSGNHLGQVEVSTFDMTRVMMGINPEGFSWELTQGESFQTPEVVMVYSDQGLNKMSQAYHRIYRKRLMHGTWRDQVRPILLNNWEATYFDFNEEKILNIAKKAKEAGVELFVLDDGWFGARNNDRAGLGDWFVNPAKFPGGLDELIGNVNALGMDFGLWVEPEMVNPDSDLYRAHPDWTYHFPHRHADELRHQLVLNMTRSDVQAYILDCLDRLLTDHNIRYIKWDMNRPFSQVGAENLADPKMYSYLHTMAVYRIVDELKRRHPAVQFESCASGGGRCDLGAISHFDQVWTSDNTDGIDRMTIQKGYSMLHPIKTMRAWVTDIAGINKPCSLDFRFHIAMQGALGLGGNLEKYSPEELEICRRNVALYKEIRPLVQFGDLYRILDADRDEVLCNQYVSRDKMQAVLFLSARGTRFFRKKMNLRFAGLAPDRAYAFTLDGVAYKKGGAFLMEVGLPVYVRGADYNQIVRLTAVE